MCQGMRVSVCVCVSAHDTPKMSEIECMCVCVRESRLPTCLTPHVHKLNEDGIAVDDDDDDGGDDDDVQTMHRRRS